MPDETTMGLNDEDSYHRFDWGELIGGTVMAAAVFVPYFALILGKKHAYDQELHRLNLRERVHAIADGDNDGTLSGQELNTLAADLGIPLDRTTNELERQVDEAAANTYQQYLKEHEQ